MNTENRDKGNDTNENQSGFYCTQFFYLFLVGCGYKKGAQSRLAETAEGTYIVNRSEIEKTTGCYENDICVINMAKETQATDEIIVYEEFLTELSLLQK